MVSSKLKDAGLGTALRQARESLHWNQRRAAAESGYSTASISRWETGVMPPSADALASYATTLGLPLEERERLSALLRRRDDPHGFVSQGADLIQLTTTLIELEQSATDISAWSAHLIEGTLQTADYARAMMRRSGLAESEVISGVAMRLARREAITRSKNPVRLTALLGETTLRHRIGGRDVMLEQLHYLAHMADADNIDVRIVPDASNYHPGLDVGNFQVIDFASRPPVAKVDLANAANFFDDDRDVEFYRVATDRVMDEAMDAEQSAATIAKAIAAVEQETT